MMQLSRALLGESLGQSRLVFRAVPALWCPPARKCLHQEAPDYYTILGVNKTSSVAEIKLAYFNMAKKFHPETNKTLDARQMFSLIAEAYDVLSDDERRAKYDETGLGEEKFGGRASGPGRQTTDSSYTSEQMYDKIFGSNAGADQEDQQDDGDCHQDFAETYAGTERTREYIAKITFEQAFLGSSLTIQYRHVGVCDKCQARAHQSPLQTLLICPVRVTTDSVPDASSVIP